MRARSGDEASTSMTPLPTETKNEYSCSTPRKRGFESETICDLTSSVSMPGGQPTGMKSDHVAADKRRLIPYTAPRADAIVPHRSSSLIYRTLTEPVFFWRSVHCWPAEPFFK